ncbi:hypothetical protein H6F32_03565 [Anabaena sp. FACHB-1237]|uniref:hypothetical protein n=1 Tax=Anabaena sp. FACHB-1237 TaxID=2692769 RepID=UPI0016814B08|nr:hypothetical protein [Anabaena sp. FACHB-1237]MBD2136685.1 hypothetical protein [Anabaena sp. FACHB-1237]
MHNNNPESNNIIDEDMLPEYNFTGGIRGKHYQDYRRGHTVTIHQEDGTIIVQHYDLKEGTIIIDPDIRDYFPDAESVNHALRTLIKLI